MSICCFSLNGAFLLIEKTVYSLKQIHLPRKRPKSNITEKRGILSGPMFSSVNTPEAGEFGSGTQRTRRAPKSPAII
jgi:hypothetical protein